MDTDTILENLDVTLLIIASAAALIFKYLGLIPESKIFELTLFLIILLSIFIVNRILKIEKEIKKPNKDCIDLKKEVENLNNSIKELNSSIKEQMSFFSKEILKLELYIHDTLNRFETLKNLEKGNILAIFPNRSDSKESVESTMNVNKLRNYALKNNIKSLNIDFLGITLRDFTDSHSGIHYQHMMNFVQKWKESKFDDDFSVNFRILFLYPYSNSALVRTIREEFERDGIKEYNSKQVGDFLKSLESGSRLYKDSSISLRQFCKWRRELEPNKNILFNLRLCTINPMVHLLKFNNEMYIEPYHLGMELKEKKKTSAQTLMIKVTEGDIYNIFDDHFNYLWNHKTTLKVENIVEKETFKKDGICHYIPSLNLDSSTRQDIQQNITIFEKYLK